MSYVAWSKGGTTSPLTPEKEKGNKIVIILNSIENLTIMASKGIK